MRVLLALALLGLSACGSSSPPPASSSSTPAAANEPFFGTWTVTTPLAPGASAGSAALAAGATASFAASTADLGGRTCQQPAYTRRWLSPATFEEAYRVKPTELALTEAQVALVDVTCASGSLDAGSTLVLRPDGTMLAVWDGVFYVLTRS